MLWRKLSPDATSVDFNQFQKRSRYRRTSHTPQNESLDQMMKRLDENSKRWGTIVTTSAKQPAIVAVLSRFGKGSEKLDDVVSDLLKNGAGEYIARSVIENPSLLADYLQMQADGISGLEITLKLVGTLGA